MSPTHFAMALKLPLLPVFLSSNRRRLFQPVKRREHSHPTESQILGSLEESRPPATKRRLQNYQSSVWDHQLIESTTSEYSEQQFMFRREVLKREVSQLIKATQDQAATLRLIDSVDRLGVAYHFDKEIAPALHQILSEDAGDDLPNTALRFRVLRQYGYKVPTDVFEKFKDKKGNFNESFIEDERGLLSLYEASYLAVEGEDILDEARDFTTRHLKELKVSSHTNVGQQIEHALDLPLRWRLSRLEAKNYIKVYEKEDGRILVLLEFAKLDFNVVQSTHQEELREISRWWRIMGFEEKLIYSRYRCVEQYIWALGVSYEVQFTKSRTKTTKVIAIAALLDDMYNTCGSIDELELFTQAIGRWNNEAIENLPYYMKITYMAVFNLVNDLIHDGVKDFGANIIPIIKKEWEKCCKSYLVEARWFNKGYTPTLEEYLSNGCITIGASTILIHGYVLLGKALGMTTIDFIEQVSKLIYWSSMVVQLTYDLATSKVEHEQGDMSSSIQCYMKDSGKTLEAAREFIMNLVIESWKGLNKECLSTTLSRHFVHVAIDFVRVSHFLFYHGFDSSQGETKDNIMSMLFESI